MKKNKEISILNKNYPRICSKVLEEVLTINNIEFVICTEVCIDKWRYGTINMLSIKSLMTNKLYNTIVYRSTIYKFNEINLDFGNFIEVCI